MDMRNIKNIFRNLNEKQIEAVKAVNGPVLILAGAGSGKCVTGNTIIFTEKGMLRIDEISKFYEINANNKCRANVVSYDLYAKRNLTNTSHWFKFKKERTIKIITKSGYQIAGTYEHPVLTLNSGGGLEFKKLGDFSGTEIVVISKNNNIWGCAYLEPDIAYLMGLLVGDGYLGLKRGIGFAQVSKPLIKEFKKILNAHFNIPNNKIKSRNRYSENDKRKSITHYIYNTRLKKKLESLGLEMVGSCEKKIPESVLKAPKESVKAFIQGLFDTDGSANNATVEITTASETLARQIQICLLNFGIRSSLKPKRVRSYPNNKYWRIAIMGTSLRIFAKEIGFKFQIHKQSNLSEMIQKECNSNVEIIPYQSQNLKYFKNTYLLGTEKYDGHYYYIFQNLPEQIYIRDYLRDRRNPSPLQLERILDTVETSKEDPQVQYMYNLSSNFFFDLVEKTVKPSKKEMVYDFSVPENHNFVGNGFINHNTRALTHRIAYLIANGVKPDNILAITFTNRAAGEIRERAEKLLASHFKLAPVPPFMGTFHAICLRILRQDIELLGYSRNFLIYDEDDQLTLVKRVMANLDIGAKKWNPSIVLSKISSAKSELIGPEEFADEAKNYAEKTISEIYLSYQAALKRTNALDFDDLIILCVELFKKYPGILEKYQEIFKYILVDEYQDINTSQYAWVNLLAKKYRNIFSIGDDAQSIFGWRGADFRNILNFEKDYPETKVIMLEQNYRSTQNILTAANQIILNNKKQKHKKLWTENPEGEKIFLKEIGDEREEGDFLIETVSEGLKNGSNFSDFAVLYRTHAQSRAVEEAMIKQGFPYRMFGGVKFYQRKEVKDILAYLRLALSPTDEVSFERIYNIPPRGLGQISYEKIKKGEIILPRQTKTLADLKNMLADFVLKSKEMGPTDLIKHIVKKTGYGKYLLGGFADGQERWENVEELFTATKKYNQTKDFEPPSGAQKFLEEVALIQEIDKLDYGEKAVKLMTLHSAKGLEFPVVFIVGMEDGVFPHQASFFDQEEMEEERRLCYVGITRAKKKLYLTYCRRRTLYGNRQYNSPSRFLFEIPEKLVSFSPLTERRYLDGEDSGNDDENIINYS